VTLFASGRKTLSAATLLNVVKPNTTDNTWNWTYGTALTANCGSGERYTVCRHAKRSEWSGDV